jgi:hypothetical protein
MYSLISFIVTPTSTYLHVCSEVLKLYLDFGILRNNEGMFNYTDHQGIYSDWGL